MIEDFLRRTWEDLIGRIGGPMSFRLILQPAMAIFFAIRDGLKGAQGDAVSAYSATTTRLAKEIIGTTEAKRALTRSQTQTT